MGASKLRLLAVSVALVGGLALVPAAAAGAQPIHASTPATVTGPTDVGLRIEAAALDEAAQRQVDGSAGPAAGEPAGPPLWLLLLLGPILVGGGIAMGVTVRRLR